MTGALSLPGLMLVVLAAIVVVAGVLAFVRGWDNGRSGRVVQVVLVLILALTGGWVLDYLAGRDLAAERRAIDARAFDLATRALTPGSALACLDTIAGEAVEDACEKALFASPEATAAAVSYVAAQLSLLAAGNDHARSGGTSNALMHTTLRRAIETDRFGIVAHVLAARGGCTPNRCSAFALLQDTTRVKTNLVQRPFESRVRNHMAGWAPAGSAAVASSPPPAEAAPAEAAPVAAVKPPSNKLYFPSSASIPPVHIMTAEPAAPPAADTIGAAEPATPTPRKPPQASSQARPPPSPGSSPARPAPLQLAPSAQ